ncbi:MAG: hypothetical protein WBD20_02475 [Pirellulaceae bacterium]
MLKRLFDPLVIGPLAGIGYFWYAFADNFTTPAMLAKAAVTLFFGWFALSCWIDSGEESQRSSLYRRIESYFFAGVFAALFLSVSGFLCYLFFIELPKMDLPWSVQLVFQGFLVVILGATIGMMGWDYLKKRRGQILIVDDEPFYLPGDTIHGAVQFKLRKPTEIYAVHLSLLGLTKRRVSSGANGGHYTEETIHYEDKIRLPVDVGQMSGDDNFVEFEIDLQNEKIAELAGDDMGVQWCIQVNVDCKGIDLDGRRWIEVVSEDQVHYESSSDSG